MKYTFCFGCLQCSVVGEPESHLEPCDRDARRPRPRDPFYADEFRPGWSRMFDEWNACHVFRRDVDGYTFWDSAPTPESIDESIACAPPVAL